MMNLNETIQHCEHIAKTNGSKECRDLYSQIAEWLKELRTIRYGRKNKPNKMKQVELERMMKERADIDIRKCR